MFHWVPFWTKEQSSKTGKAGWSSSNTYAGRHVHGDHPYHDLDTNAWAGTPGSDLASGPSIQ